LSVTSLSAKEFVSHDLFGCQPLFRVFVKQRAHQVLQGGREVFRHLQLLLLGVNLNLKLAFSIEGELTEVTEAVDDHSKGPNVCREGIVSTLLNHMAFGCSEARSALAVIQACHSRLQLVPRDGEVSQLYFVRPGVKKYVIRLDIAMHYFLASVQVNDSRSQLSKKVLGH